MYRVQDIDLREVFQKYLDTPEILADGKKRYKCICPFHEDKDPSMVLYDNTKEGRGWAYHCFVCGAHGSAPTALTASHYCASEEDSIKLLEDDFHLVLPDKVVLADFCEYKGLDIEFCKANGWNDGSKGIRIPFMDEAGTVTNIKVRTKYKGSPKYHFEVEGKSQTPYGLHWLPEYSKDVLYITEGETDCMTLRQAGYNAIGIGGANAFKDEYASILKRFSKVVIVNDTDAAGQKLVESITRLVPNVFTLILPTGIKDINDYHVYRCGGEINTFIEKVAELPQTPATPDAFIEAVVNGQMSPTDKNAWVMIGRQIASQPDRLLFKEEFAKKTKTAKPVVAQCIKSLMEVSDTSHAPSFQIKDNCYVKLVTKEGMTYNTPISNFVIRPKCDIITDEGTIRVVDLVSASGKVARSVHFDPEMLSATSKFNQQCLASGDFIFTGTQEDLFTICYTIFMVAKKVVYSPRMIGQLPGGEWLLGNCGINLDGTLIKPDDDGIITIGDTAYKPRSVTIDEDNGDMPMPDLTYYNAPYPADYLPKLARDFKACFGTYGAWLGLGWVVAGWFSNSIFKEHGCFPYLFVTGKRASGKSVFCTLLQQSYGFNPSTCGMSIESPTPVGMLRYLTYRSSLPQWYDDYRNSSKRIQGKDSLLLDIYNRHGSVKGTKTGGVTQETINGFILLSGEDTPANNAVATRCSIVTLSEHAREARLLGTVTEQFRKLPPYALKWARQATTDPEPLLASIRSIRPSIEAASNDLRDSLNRSIFAGAFMWAFGDALSDEELQGFLEYVRTSSVEQVETSNDTHPMAAFLNEFPEYSKDSRLLRNVDYIIEGDIIYLRLNSFHKAWSDYHRVPPLSSTVLMNYIRQEPAFTGDVRKSFDTVGRQRCYGLRLSKLEDEFPDFFEHMTFIINDTVNY